MNHGSFKTRHSFLPNSGDISIRAQVLWSEIHFSRKQLDRFSALYMVSIITCCERGKMFPFTLVKRLFLICR